MLAFLLYVGGLCDHRDSNCRIEWWWLSFNHTTATDRNLARVRYTEGTVPSSLGLGMYNSNNSARRGAGRAVNRGRRRNVWGIGGGATASGQQSLSATAGFSQTRAPRDQGPHELSGLQECMEDHHRAAPEYCPPHSWDDLAGAAKLWTGSQVRVLERADICRRCFGGFILCER